MDRIISLVLGERGDAGRLAREQDAFDRGVGPGLDVLIARGQGRDARAAGLVDGRVCRSIVGDNQEIGMVGAQELGELVEGRHHVRVVLTGRAAHAAREDPVDQLVRDHLALQPDLRPLARGDVADHRGQEPLAVDVEGVQPHLDVERRAVQPAMPPFEPLRHTAHRLGHQFSGLVRGRGAARLVSRREFDRRLPHDLFLGSAPEHPQRRGIAVEDPQAIHQEDRVLGRLEQGVEHRPDAVQRLLHNPRQHVLARTRHHDGPRSVPSIQGAVREAGYKRPLTNGARALNSSSRTRHVDCRGEGFRNS
jgi:hypothetical protein